MCLKLDEAIHSCFVRAAYPHNSGLKRCFHNVGTVSTEHASFCLLLHLNISPATLLTTTTHSVSLPFCCLNHLFLWWIRLLSSNSPGCDAGAVARGLIRAPSTRHPSIYLATGHSPIPIRRELGERCRQQTSVVLAWGPRSTFAWT